MSEHGLSERNLSERNTSSPPESLLSVRDLKMHFPVTEGVLGRVAGHVQAVDGVSFDILPGETLGMVGESGCGKTTIGRCILRLLAPTSGRVNFQGVDLVTAADAELRKARRDLQVVFQDPFSSLNPRLRVVDIVGEALVVHGLTTSGEVRAKVGALLERVGLPPGALDRYPHEFSGGQRQRVGIARALALNPKLIICDEAVSALDVSIQAQVINLLIDLQQELGISYLFIAHDLSVVKHISDRIAVMYLGQMVELASSADLFERPGHPYTQALLSAIPVADPRHKRSRIVLEGDVPSPLDPPSGCRFHPRCPAVFDRCSKEEPTAVALASSGAVHSVKCFHAYGLEADGKWHLTLQQRVQEASAHNNAERTQARAASTGSAISGVEPAFTKSMSSESPSSGGDDEDSEEDLFELPLPHLRHALTGLSAAAALTLLVTGHWIGALLPSVLCLVVARGAVRWCFLLAGVAALGGSAYFQARARVAQAMTQGQTLTAELTAYATNWGEYPSHLTQLRWRLYEAFPTGEPRDPWGNPWRYERTQQGYRLLSSGRDGKPGTDDLVFQR